MIEDYFQYNITMIFDIITLTFRSTNNCAFNVAGTTFVCIIWRSRQWRICWTKISTPWEF